MHRDFFLKMMSPIVSVSHHRGENQFFPHNTPNRIGTQEIHSYVRTVFFQDESDEPMKSSYIFIYVYIIHT